MSHFTLIRKNLPVHLLLRELDPQPDIWNQRQERRVGDSPHRETSDIWCRYAHPGWLAKTGDYSGPHKSMWWPVAERIPSVRVLSGMVMAALGGNLEEGGVLITRIPPGRQVYPHHDRGTWHAEYFTTKVWVPLRANDQCFNTVEDEEMVWEPGDAWSHDNLLTHSVRNEGTSERLCLILCYRRV
jgi:hypothetical protein